MVRLPGERGGITITLPTGGAGSRIADCDAYRRALDSKDPCKDPQSGSLPQGDVPGGYRGRALDRTKAATITSAAGWRRVMRAC